MHSCNENAVNWPIVHSCDENAVNWPIVRLCDGQKQHSQAFSLHYQSIQAHKFNSCCFSPFNSLHTVEAMRGQAACLDGRHSFYGFVVLRLRCGYFEARQVRRAESLY